MRSLIVVLLVALLLSGCSLVRPAKPLPNSTRFHVWCYQDGKLLVSRIVVKTFLSSEEYGYYWKDQETGGKVLLPSPESGAACSWLGLPDAE